MEVFSDNLKGSEGALNRFFIRCIGNNKGEYGFAIFQYDIGLALKDAPWSIQVNEDDDPKVEYWKGQIEEKVTKMVYGGLKNAAGYHQGMNQSGIGFQGHGSEHGYGGSPNGYGNNGYQGRPVGGNNVHKTYPLDNVDDGVEGATPLKKVGKKRKPGRPPKNKKVGKYSFQEID